MLKDIIKVIKSIFVFVPFGIKFGFNDEEIVIYRNTESV